MTHVIACIVCGKESAARRASKKYCSGACRAKGSRVGVVSDSGCSECGATRLSECPPQCRWIRENRAPCTVCGVATSVPRSRPSASDAMHHECRTRTGSWDRTTEPKQYCRCGARLTEPGAHYCSPQCQWDHEPCRTSCARCGKATSVPIGRRSNNFALHRACWRDLLRETAATQPSKRRPPGYGYRHKAARKRALAEFVDGTPCPFCSLPMKAGESLDLDHSDPKSVWRGDPGDRLAHSSCNRRDPAVRRARQKLESSG